MPTKIDSEGTFIFEVVESAIGVTNKNSYPQWVARLNAKKKWIENAEEMAHFKITEPAYVDWNFDEEIIAYICLFNSADTFTTEGKDRTAMLNYDQLKLALGWDGTEFDSLADGSMLKKMIQGRVQSSEYPKGSGTTSLKVEWIDSVDAPATRTLKSLAPDAVSALTKKLQINVKKVVAAPAKPVVPGKPKPSTPAASTPSGDAPSVGASSPTASTPATAATASSPTTTSPSSAPAPKPKKTPKAAAPVETPPPPTPEKSDRPKTSTQGDAWEFVCANKGDNEDSVVEESWLSACGEVLNDRDQDTATPEEWAKIRDTALKDLAV